jgi:hypothetical protein
MADRGRKSTIEEAMNESPNQRDGGDGAIPRLLRIARLWPAASHHER